jgi:hypothetical protein
MTKMRWRALRPPRAVAADATLAVNHVIRQASTVVRAGVPPFEQHRPQAEPADVGGGQQVGEVIVLGLPVPRLVVDAVVGRLLAGER